MRINSNHKKILACRREADTKSYSELRSYWHLMTTGRGGISFLVFVDCTPGQTPFPGVHSQQKLNSMDSKETEYEVEWIGR